MGNLIDVAAYPLGDSVLVEVVQRDETDELVVSTYEFDVDDPEKRVLRPRQTLEDAHKPVVQDVLHSDGYSLQSFP